MTLEYLIDPINGDDLAPGTLTDPWRTTKHAGRALARLDANGQSVRLWLGAGTHGALALPGTPLNLAMAHYDDGLIVEGDGDVGDVALAVPDGGDWAIHNAARATFRNLMLTGNPESGGVKCASRFTSLYNVKFENVPLPMRVKSFSRLEADNLIFAGASNECISVYENAVAEIKDMAFDGWSYDEVFARFAGPHASIQFRGVDMPGVSPGPAAMGYDVAAMSALWLDGLAIPESVASVVHPDGRVYA